MNASEQRLRFLDEVRREVGPDQRVEDVYTDAQLDEIWYQVRDEAED